MEKNFRMAQQNHARKFEKMLRDIQTKINRKLKGNVQKILKKLNNKNMNTSPMSIYAQQRYII